jgi:hypothetical protein
MGFKIYFILIMCIIVTILISVGVKIYEYETQPKKSSDTTEEISGVKTMTCGTYATDYYTSGMHYKLFQGPKGGMFVANVTKDSLECIKLKQ